MNMKVVCLSAVLLLCPMALNAQVIDLECDALAKRMVSRFAAEGVLNPGKQSQQRAQAIGVELCSEVQESAQVQHKAAKESALQNWIFENRPEKPGNKRLKNLKR